jgi:hypothetical protein
MDGTVREEYAAMTQSYLSPLQDEMYAVSTTRCLFRLGQVVVTAQAAHALERNAVAVEQVLSRHQQGDWGDLTAYEWRWNGDALKNGAMLMSVYHLEDHSIIWVVTVGDQSMTRVSVPTDVE